MSDFDDDLLDDLLSEGSSDSFFDDPKTKSSKKNISKRNEAEKSTVSKIFGLENKEIKKDLDWLTDAPTEKETGKLNEDPPSKRKPMKKVSFEDDILDTLGLGSTGSAPPEGMVKDATASTQKDTVKKKALLDDILGLKLPKNSDDKKETKNISISSKPSLTSTSTKSEEESKDTTTTNVEFSLSNFSRENRRSRTAPSSFSRDPLGLLTTPGDIQEKERYSPIPKAEATSQGSRKISWLDDDNVPVRTLKSNPGLPPPAGDMNKGTSSSEFLQSDRTSTANDDNSRKELMEENRDSEISGLNRMPNDTSIQDIFLQRINSQGGNYSNVSLALQQQESLLVMALHMKKYEESLQDIQKKQQEIFNRQEEYFKRVVEEQLLKQHTIDSNLRIQQDKINKHIETLMFSTHVEQKEEVDTEKDAVISLLKEKQHEEAFIMEESYKKQISLLEETMKSVEDRLRTEINDNAKYYKEIIENLHEQHKAEIEKHENKIKELSNNHEKELQSLRESHNRIVEDIKNEYGEMVNNFKQSKQYEKQAFEGATTYVQKLDASLNVLTNSSSNINEIKSKLEEEYNILSKAKEESMKAKEKEIEMMRATLEKARESSDNERSQLMALVRNLELKLAEQSQNSREDRWAFQQATSTLVAKTAAADREAEFQRAAIEREREQLKTLKENLLAEQEKLVLQLTEEKLAISAEKSRLEISAKLANNYDVQKAQVEIEAAVKAARDAAAKTDLERENLLKAQHELETLKRDLRDREHVLLLKEKSFESLQKELDDRATEAERALAQAKLIEKTYIGRTRDMHKQVAILAQREKKLAEEKLNLSKERLTLQMDLQQLRRCTLCSSSVRFSTVQEIGYDDYDVLDPDLARLRNEANDESIRSPLVEGRTED